MIWLEITFLESTVIGARMSHWKWKETKQHPSRARSGHQISCSLVSLHFLCDILAPITVQASYITDMHLVSLGTAGPYPS